MECHVLTTICLVKNTYDEVVCKLVASNSSIVNVIKILETPIGVLNRNLLNSFVNLIDLELSDCSIFSLDDDVFEDLINLTAINLSNNVISLISHNLFYRNTKLRTINVKNNLLHSVDTSAFCHLTNLEILDLSYNHIAVLNTNFLKNASLLVLRLNNSYISDITCSAFDDLVNLTDLSLDNNRIEILRFNVFEKVCNLKHLNLNCNRLNKIYPNTFWKLKELSTLYLRNNCFTHCFGQLFFAHNTKLTDLDMSENEISYIEKFTFDHCPNLMFLNLKVTGTFQIRSIKPLMSLTKFEIIYTPCSIFSFTGTFWRYFRNKLQLTVLKLILQEVYGTALFDFSCLINLEYLHIEYLNPNDGIRDINFYVNFNHMHRLKTLILKRLNSFTISKCYFGPQNITHLDLTGVKNTVIDYAFQNYVLLNYLNLSFSGIKFILTNAFDQLVHLEYLVLEYSKLKSISKNIFQYNSKLRILNCANCLIEVIEDGSFSSLHCLEKLDLSNNWLLNISENTFFGLNRETCNIIL